MLETYVYSKLDWLCFNLKEYHSLNYKDDSIFGIKKYNDAYEVFLNFLLDIKSSVFSAILVKYDFNEVVSFFYNEVIKYPPEKFIYSEKSKHDWITFVAKLKKDSPL